MKKAYIFLAEGFEEMEAIIPIDMLRRAGIDCVTVSVTADKKVKGAHNIPVTADITFFESSLMDADALILPGGGLGTENLKKHTGLKELITDYNKRGLLLCAICAAPTVFGEMLLLAGKSAVCYPGCEEGLFGASPIKANCCIDGNFITGRAAGGAVDFALTIIEALLDAETAEKIKKEIVYIY